MNCLFFSILFNLAFLYFIYLLSLLFKDNQHIYYIYTLHNATKTSSYNTDIKYSLINSNEEYDITYVSQTSVIRLFFFNFILKRWHGPLSVTIAYENEDLRNISMYMKNSRLSYSLYHVNASYYPINKLRNIAIQRIKTTHFFLSDMDFWPSNNLYESFHDLPNHIKRDDWLSIIVPAYQYIYKDKNKLEFRECILKVANEIPLTKSDLKDCLQSKHCQRFRPEANTHNYHYSRWINEPKSKNVVMIQHFKKPFQEPYIFIRRSDHMPMFNELFYNYGRNKVEWIEHLRYIGYKFAILVQGFGIDVPHPSSRYMQQYLNGRVNGVLPFVDVYNKVFSDIYKEPDRSIVYI